MNELINLIKRAKPYIEQAHDDAEARHDNYGEDYMNEVDWEIMKETDSLLYEIDKIINDENSYGAT